MLAGTSSESVAPATHLPPAPPGAATHNVEATVGLSVVGGPATTSVGAPPEPASGRHDGVHVRFCAGMKWFTDGSEGSGSAVSTKLVIVPVSDQPASVPRLSMTVIGCNAPVVVWAEPVRSIASMSTLADGCESDS